MRSAVLSGDAWGRAVDAARAGRDGDELVAEVARQLAAPVRGTIVASRGDVQTTTRLTLCGEHALLVTQAGRRAADGRQRFAPERQVTVAAVEDLWAALTEAIPPVDVLRAPAHGGADRGAVVARGAQGVALVDAADARLDLVVEAYDGEVPCEVWARAWAVVDDRLLDLRSGDGELVVRERTPGAVAAELEWALVGAVAAVTR